MVLKVLSEPFKSLKNAKTGFFLSFYFLTLQFKINQLNNWQRIVDQESSTNNTNGDALSASNNMRTYYVLINIWAKIFPYQKNTDVFFHCIWKALKRLKCPLPKAVQTIYYIFILRRLQTHRGLGKGQRACPGKGAAGDVLR